MLERRNGYDALDAEVSFLVQHFPHHDVISNNYFQVQIFKDFTFMYSLALAATIKDLGLLK